MGVYKGMGFTDPADGWPKGIQSEFIREVEVD
jgi:hypothetical protein